MYTETLIQNGSLLLFWFRFVCLFIFLFYVCVYLADASLFVDNVFNKEISATSVLPSPQKQLELPDIKLCPWFREHSVHVFADRVQQQLFS